jgi:Predicted O-methyltransferase
MGIHQEQSLLRLGERLDDLQCGGLRIIQNPVGFCFGLDALLLADFARIEEGHRVIELGTGSGVVPLLLSQRSRAAELIGVEGHADTADRARRSVAWNGLQERISIRTLDVREAAAVLGMGAFDVVLANPPYGKRPQGRAVPANGERAMARFEMEGVLADWMAATAALLREGARAYFVYSVSRAQEVLCEMHRAGLSPASMQEIYDRPGVAAKLCRLSARKGSAAFEDLAPLVLRDEQGQPNDAWRRLYREP